MESSKRRFWQFHLLTAVVLMLWVGSLIGLNIKEGREFELFSTVSAIQYYGWPMPALYRQIHFNDSSEPDIMKRTFDSGGDYHWIWDDAGDFDFFGKPRPWRPWRSWLLIDIVTALGSVAGLAVVFEFVLRRRDRRTA